MPSSQMTVFSGNANPELSAEIAGYLSLPLGKAVVGRFSDGEMMTEIQDNVRGHDVFVVQPTSAPTNDNLMELLVMIDAVRRSSARRITAVVPYFGYARQDRRPRSARVPITAKVVARMIGNVKADRVLTVDLHADQIQGFFSIPGDILYAYHVLIDHMKDLVSKMERPVMVSPDLGFAKKARNYATSLDIPLAFIEKRRLSNVPTAEALTLIGDVTNRDCIILDEEISTGNTIVTAVNLIKEHGAKSITVVFIHPVLSPGAVEKLVALPVERFITTDTIPISAEKKAKFGDRLKIITIASLLGEVIRRASEGRSVGQLFNE